MEGKACVHGAIKLRDVAFVPSSPVNIISAHSYPGSEKLVELHGKSPTMEMPIGGVLQSVKARTIPVVAFIHPTSAWGFNRIMISPEPFGPVLAKSRLFPATTPESLALWWPEEPYLRFIHLREMYLEKKREQQRRAEKRLEEANARMMGSADETKPKPGKYLNMEELRWLRRSVHKSWSQYLKFVGLSLADEGQAAQARARLRGMIERDKVHAAKMRSNKVEERKRMVREEKQRQRETYLLLHNALIAEDAPDASGAGSSPSASDYDSLTTVSDPEQFPDASEEDGHLEEASVTQEEIEGGKTNEEMSMKVEKTIHVRKGSDSVSTTDEGYVSTEAGEGTSHIKPNRRAAPSKPAQDMTEAISHKVKVDANNSRTSKVLKPLPYVLADDDLSDHDQKDLISTSKSLYAMRPMRLGPQLSPSGADGSILLDHPELTVDLLPPYYYIPDSDSELSPSFDGKLSCSE